MKVGAGDITKVMEVEVIVNAANGIGVMGAGLAGALAKAGGEMLSKTAKTHCDEFGPFNAGTCYRTDAGLLKRRGVKEIYHAVTMKFPGGMTSLQIVEDALQSVMKEAMAQGVRSIAVPGLGIGIGRLDRTVVAQRMASILELYNGLMEILVVDRNELFISDFKDSLSIESEPWVST